VSGTAIISRVSPSLLHNTTNLRCVSNDISNFNQISQKLVYTNINMNVCIHVVTGDDDQAFIRSIAFELVLIMKLLDNNCQQSATTFQTQQLFSFVLPFFQSSGPNQQLVSSTHMHPSPVQFASPSKQYNPTFSSHPNASSSTSPLSDIFVATQLPPHVILACLASSTPSTLCTHSQQRNTPSARLSHGLLRDKDCPVSQGVPR